jgi:hypothetical protein
MTSSEIRVRDSTGGSGLPVGLSICHVVCPVTVVCCLCVSYTLLFRANECCSCGLICFFFVSEHCTCFFRHVHLYWKRIWGINLLCQWLITFSSSLCFSKKKNSVLNEEYASKLLISVTIFNRNQTYFQFWTKQVLRYAYQTYFLINKKKNIAKKKNDQEKNMLW